MTTQGQRRVVYGRRRSAPTLPAGTGMAAAAARRAKGAGGWLGAEHRLRFLPLVSVVAGLILWELMARASISPIFVPIGDIATTGVRLARNGELLDHLMASGRSFLLGYSAAVIVGTVTGVALGLSRVLRKICEPWLYAFYSIPTVALAPIFILAFGIGASGHVVIVFTVALFVVLVNTVAGIGTTEQQHLDVARAYCASRWRTIRYVYLPSAVPFVVTGMRLGITRALIGVVVAELFGARAGLGYLVLQSQQTFRTADMYVGVVILAAVGIASTSLLERWERRLAVWRPQR